MANILGTTGGDILNGTSADDTIDGAAGNDLLNGLDGNDLLIGGTGNDTLFGGNANDTFIAGAGVDWHYGGAGFDTIVFTGAFGTFGFSQSWDTQGTFVSHGFNSSEGAAYFDTSVERVKFSDREISLLTGTSASETLIGTDGIDWIHSQAGNDVVDGSDGDDRIYGEAGNDTLIGGNGSDWLSGMDGNDLLVGGLGDDSLYGNAGTDTAQFDGEYKNYTISALYASKDGYFSGYEISSQGEGIDFVANDVEQLQFNDRLIALIAGTTGSDTLSGTSGNDLIQGLEGSDLVHGGALDDTIYGGAGNDRLNGDAGNDVLHGGDGDDSLNGGEGNDNLTGGSGNDTLAGGAGVDLVSYTASATAVLINLATGSANGNDGIDVLSGIEGAEGSPYNDTLVGSTGGDVFYGFGGSDFIDGAAGNDTLYGDGGNDTLDGGAGIDVASYDSMPLANGGINAFIENGAGSVSDGFGSVDTLVNIEVVAGSHSNDTLSGGLGDQWFIGRGGSDVIDGGDGNDWISYLDDPAGVIVNLGTGNATDGWGELAGTDTLISIENVEGSELADSLVGSAVANELYGRGGDDSLDGGANVDIAVFDGNRSNYTVLTTTSGYAVSGLDGADTLTNIERLQFSDKRFALDLNVGEAAGNTVRIIGAAFDANYITPEFVNIGISLFDSGMTMLQVCELALDTDLYVQLAGSHSNVDFVNTVYKNVVGVLPSAGERDFYVGLLQGSGGTMTQAELLILAANADSNAVNIDLVALQQSGVEFV